MAEWYVGQPVIVTDASTGRLAVRSGIVAKVGRKLLTVRYAYSEGELGRAMLAEGRGVVRQFDMDDGAERSNYHRRRCYSLAQWAEQTERVELERRIRDGCLVRLELGAMRRLSVQALRELAEWSDRHSNPEGDTP